LVEKDNKEVY